jgi:hypothetical protein
MQAQCCGSEHKDGCLARARCMMMRCDHACGFEFPSELALARLGLDLQVVGVLLFTCETIIPFVGYSTNYSMAS